MYGITEEDKIFIDKKIEDQTNFLKKYVFDVAGGQFSLLDSNMTANISPEKYFSEVNNRVNTLFNYSKAKGLKPVFVTLTAPSELHYTGKKGLYCPYTKDKLFDYGEGLKSINPHDTAIYLSVLWAKFLRLSILRKLKKQTGESMVYLRVYEPHKSAVPHLHAMLFIPQNFIIPLKKKFKQYFSNFGISKQATDFRYTWHNNAGGAVAYIIKYINKTFKNAKEGFMSDEAYYFVKHRIIRFLTSRTLVPLSVYRKIKHDETARDLLDVSYEYKEGAITRLFGDTSIIHIRFCQDEKEYYDYLLYQKNFNISNQISSTKQLYAQTPSQWHNKKKEIPVYLDDKLVAIRDNKIVFYKTPVLKMTDYDLYFYFHDLDIDTCDLNHYGNVKNELIKRGLINDEILPLSAYSSFLNIFFPVLADVLALQPGKQ